MEGPSGLFLDCSPPQVMPDHLAKAAPVVAAAPDGADADVDLERAC